jgi:hypothetical protein
LTVNAIPTITPVFNAGSCGVGSVVLKATASAGTINWYAAATGGVPLGTEAVLQLLYYLQQLPIGRNE